MVGVEGSYVVVSVCLTMNITHELSVAIPGTHPKTQEHPKKSYIQYIAHLMHNGYSKLILKII